MLHACSCCSAFSIFPSLQSILWVANVECALAKSHRWSNITLDRSWNFQSNRKGIEWCARHKNLERKEKKNNERKEIQLVDAFMCIVCASFVDDSIQAPQTTCVLIGTNPISLYRLLFKTSFPYCFNAQLADHSVNYSPFSNLSSSIPKLSDFVE